MYISETKLTVRYVETDKMGIVHHSNYYIWFEVGENRIYQALWNGIWRYGSGQGDDTFN